MRAARSVEPARVLRAIRRVNRLRQASLTSAAGADPGDLAAAEAELEERYRPSERLAVYGTLAPGQVNHGEVVDLRSEWRPGFVRGELAPEGWGTTYGFPAFRWNPEAPPVPVQVLVSPDLPRHWPRLDAFEGPGYHRILVPVEDEEAALVTVANLYAGVPTSS